MSTTVEIDPILKQALKQLHSPNPDSAEKIRLALDELIRQRHGASKMLINTLSMKFLAEESNPPGTSVKRQKSIDSKPPAGIAVSSVGANNSNNIRNKSPSPDDLIMISSSGSSGISISDVEMKTIDVDVEEEENLKDFGDLACVVCHEMVFTANNRLVECADCHALYHQNCHKPKITDDDANEQEFSWCCTTCKDRLIVLKTSSPAPIISIPSPSKSSSSHSSSSSSSSSSTHSKTNVHRRHKSSSSQREPSNLSSKHKSRGSSRKTSSSSKSSTSFGGLLPSSTPGNVGGATPAIASSSSSAAKSSPVNSAPIVTPNINIISVDKRLQIMKKKAAKQQETKRKHK